MNQDKTKLSKLEGLAVAGGGAVGLGVVISCGLTAYGAITDRSDLLTTGSEIGTYSLIGATAALIAGGIRIVYQLKRDHSEVYKPNYQI